jgi:hypothetical protein
MVAAMSVFVLALLLPPPRVATITPMTTASATIPAPASASQSPDGRGRWRSFVRTLGAWTGRRGGAAVLAFGLGAGGVGTRDFFFANARRC